MSEFSVICTPLYSGRSYLAPLKLQSFWVSEDPVQHAHKRSLIRVLNIRICRNDRSSHIMLLAKAIWFQFAGYLTFLHFLLLWDYRAQHFYLGAKLPSTRGYASWEMMHLPLSLTNSIKPSLLFSNFECCVSKGSPFILSSVISKIVYLNVKCDMKSSWCALMASRSQPLTQRGKKEKKKKKKKKKTEK